MAYATYSYYTRTYLGTVFQTDAVFARYVKRASVEIDHATFGRLSNMPCRAIPDEVRDAACAVAEKIYDIEVNGGGNFASESNDGYSVSYRGTNEAQTKSREIYRIIRTYLDNTGLLYRGYSEKYDLRHP